MAKKNKTVDDTPISVTTIEGIRYETHLPLTDWFNSSVINNWISNKCALIIKEEAKKIIDAYRIYSANIGLNSYESIDRRAYTKSDYIIALRKKEVIGGAWSQNGVVHANAKDNNPIIIETLDILMNQLINTTAQ